MIRRGFAFSLRLLPVFMVLLAASSVFTASCTSDAPPVAPAVRMRDSIPVMTSYGVSKLISDSGVIRYKIVAEEWKVFDRTHPSKQTFEKGLLLEKFNEKFHIEMYITADTAYWYNQNLWELRGRVCVWNKTGVIFRSQLLYWNMDTHEFYSNKHSHLITPDREVWGNSFHSDEQMTKYEINYSKASFPLPEGQMATDTTAAANAAAAQPPMAGAAPAKPKADKSEPLPPKGHFK